MINSNRAFILATTGSLLLALSACAAEVGIARNYMMLEDKEPGHVAQENKKGMPAPMPTETSEFEHGQGKPPTAMLQDDSSGKAEVNTDLTSKPRPMPAEPR